MGRGGQWRLEVRHSVASISPKGGRWLQQGEDAMRFPLS